MTQAELDLVPRKYLFQIFGGPGIVIESCHAEVKEAISKKLIGIDPRIEKYLPSGGVYWSTVVNNDYKHKYQYSEEELKEFISYEIDIRESGEHAYALEQTRKAKEDTAKENTAKAAKINRERNARQEQIEHDYLNVMPKSPAPQSVTARSKKLRAERANKGLKEVRGVWTKPQHEAAIKVYALAINQQEESK